MDTTFKTLTRISPVLVSVALFFLAGYAPKTLIFDRHAIAAGEFWRLVTCHFVHCDFEHLLLNLFGLMCLILIFDRLPAKKIWLSLATGMVLVDAWIWFEMKDVSYYCGLSGIENSLLVAGLGTIWINNQARYAVIAGVLSLAKIIYEISTKTALFSNVSWQAVPEAHAAGFAAGVVLIAFFSLIKKPQDICGYLFKPGI